MRKAQLPEVIETRDYGTLASIANSEIQNGHWEGLVREMESASKRGKARDALVNLLQLEEIGGTDSNVFGVFSRLTGSDLNEIQLNAYDIAVAHLKKQLERKNTYFIDTEGIATTPFAVLFEDITQCRQCELAELKSNSSRNDLLLTYYGFMILTMSGLSNRNAGQMTTSPYYRRWRRRYLGRPEIAHDVADAITQLTQDFGTSTTINGQYETLGTSKFFRSKCEPYNSGILAHITRMTLYMTPWDRAKAAKSLGNLGDARVLPHMHNCLRTESDYRARARIAESIGLVGHESSIQHLEDLSRLSCRYDKKLAVAAVRGVGSIFSAKSTGYLAQILEARSSPLTAEAILGLSKQKYHGLPKILAPLLNSNSRPVLRATVEALLASGGEGQKAIAERLPKIVRKLYRDRLAKHLIPKILALKGARTNAEIQRFFVGRLSKSLRKLKQLRRVSNQWYRVRRERYERSRIETDISTIIAIFGNPIPHAFIPVLREISSTSGLNSLIMNYLQMYI
jgi:hypothetical protein